MFPRVEEAIDNCSNVGIAYRSSNFVVYSDASKKGLGCVLMQNGNVIAYASR
jgi:hypothetical protein